ncbi:MAG: alanine:cation symporter family protein [Muribaculaceae bacterium]|nr:alanine:cation symporter family protein [Muribaculaceae bacterium]
MFEKILGTVGDSLSDWLLLPLLVAAAIWFTLRMRGVQFTMFGEMCRQLTARSAHPGISSFQAFAVSIASRVGTGNLAGVATAIIIGGPGAVFWMWVMALLGAASAFVESTLAQLYKVPDGHGGFRGGPAYYILHGLKSRWWAVLFAVLISVTFGLAYNSVQSNTIAEAFHSSWQIPVWLTATAVSLLSAWVIWGGLKSIARFSQWVVPVMAIAYILVAMVVVAMNLERVPDVFRLIVENAFGIDEAVGGTLGGAMAMGIRRGLFSNEAGEGSAPNVAATAHVSHPVKQGLVQALGVFTDTLLICTTTALLILLSGVHIDATVGGISLTQQALDSEFRLLPGAGAWFVSIAILFFAFTSIVANYYYGETNIRFISGNPLWVTLYRCVVTAFVLAGGMSSLGVVWSLADITMSLMAICNLCAIVPLGRYARRCLDDFRRQRRCGADPQYHKSVNPDIAGSTPCWPD